MIRFWRASFFVLAGCAGALGGFAVVTVGAQAASQAKGALWHWVVCDITLSPLAVEYEPRCW